MDNHIQRVRGGCGITGARLAAPGGRRFTTDAFKHAVDQDIAWGGSRGRVRSARVTLDGRHVDLAIATDAIEYAPRRLDEVTLVDGTSLIV
jgi:hypothetical protein